MEWPRDSEEDAPLARLEQLATSRGLPSTITTDNGPEFTGRALHLWAQATGVSLNHIQPGKPMQNAFIESFNGTFRDDCLNQHWFSSLAEARLLINHWRHEYNHLRPHSSIGRIPPNSFALRFPKTIHTPFLSLQNWPNLRGEAQFHCPHGVRPATTVRNDQRR